MENMDGETCLRQAYGAIFHGDFELALHWFGQAIAQDPDNASYHYKASITCARSGKTELAEQHARKAIELDPEDPVYAWHLQRIEARQQMAQARLLLERPDPDTARAKAMLREAEVLDPLSGEAKLLLGLACRMSGDLRSAIVYVRDALSLEPQHEEAGRLLQQWRSESRRFHPTPSSPHKPKRNR